ncbi:glutathione S-transferase U9-like [Momordica charantia]|uniref:glutathione transferase n=1 Tax=Momordica charantia TaxID=3673 RepID=A0A6J1C8E4_MOMCH|nr:glutathione S-transferase U9-like [Momordica charantia]
MAEENKVVLHGMWASPFAKRVELALRIKGIPFDYVEEDLKNKSSSILNYNPVHKKVPVVLHNGKPISESFVILEYIDEVWNNEGPRLLPQDPYTRAQVRFWADFVQKQLFEGLFSAIKTEGEAQERAVDEVREKLKVFEEQGLRSLLEEGSRFVNGDEMGFLDIVTFTVIGIYKIQEEFLGIKFLDEEKTPILFSWLTRLNEHPIAKETAPPKDKLVGLLQFVRHNALRSPAV